MWQQRTKRRGNYKVSLSNLHDHPDIGWDIIFLVEDLINRLKKCNIVSLTIRNYSNCSDRLMDEVASWLEIPEDTFSFPTISRINRSLTWSELVFQKSLNKTLGRSGYLISDPLCEKLTEIKAEKVFPPLNVQKAIWTTLSETLKRMNEQIPEQHHYRCDIQNPEPLPEVFSFTQQQIEIITESFGNEILRLRLQLKTADKTISNLKNENAILKNEIANPLENKSTITIITYLIKRIKNKTLISIKTKFR
jgi:hypothetical protein